jgi:hypothetical protein
MNYVLRKYIGRFYYVYLDDIVFWSDTIEEHTYNARLILDALWKHRIVASAEKSKLYADAILFLGTLYRQGELKSLKIKSIKSLLRGLQHLYKILKNSMN